MWQHTYTLNALLVIQETADTFGLLCLALLFLIAQVFARNSMFAIFLSKASNSLNRGESAPVSRFRLLSLTSTARLSPALGKKLTYVVARLRQSTY